MNKEILDEPQHVNAGWQVSGSSSQGATSILLFGLFSSTLLAPAFIDYLMAPQRMLATDALISTATVLVVPFVFGWKWARLLCEGRYLSFSTALRRYLRQIVLGLVVICIPAGFMLPVAVSHIQSRGTGQYLASIDIWGNANLIPGILVALGIARLGAFTHIFFLRRKR